jgi:CYTH domain-containing protein
MEIGGGCDMENMEIEKKYTIKKLPDNLEQYECKVIKQAYLNTSPVVRIRQSNDKYTLTYKGAGLMAREEYNLPLDRASFEHLLKKADGNIISKKRYIIPIEEPKFNDSCLPIVNPGLKIELDIFDEPFAPLVMAEVEFSSVELAEAFIAPDWFDEDVTNNVEYHNSYMSTKKF